MLGGVAQSKLVRSLPARRFAESSDPSQGYRYRSPPVFFFNPSSGASRGAAWRRDASRCTAELCHAVLGGVDRSNPRNHCAALPRIATYPASRRRDAGQSAVRHRGPNQRIRVRRVMPGEVEPSAVTRGFAHRGSRCRGIEPIDHLAMTQGQVRRRGALHSTLPQRRALRCSAEQSKELFHVQRRLFDPASRDRFR